MSEEIAVEQSHKPVDAAARARALDITQSFAVSAPAGSGKTGLLTQRVLKLLAHCQQPEEVLAITFTRKAAGEMRERLIHALLKARDEPRPENSHDAVTWDLARALLEQDQRQNWQLLQAPQRLRFQTIDGLCRSLASQLPIDSGLGAPGEPLEQASIAFELAVTRLLEGLDADQPDSALSRLLLHLDNDLGQLNKLLQTLLEKREQWLAQLLGVGSEDAKAYFHHVIDELVAENLGALEEALGSFAGELAELANYAGQNLQQENPAHPLCRCSDLSGLPGTDPTNLLDWLALTELLVTGKGELRKPGGLNKKLGFISPAKKDPEYDRAQEYKARMKAVLEEMAGDPNLLAAINEIRQLPTSLPESQWQLLQAMAEVLPQMVAQLKLVFQQLGATDYTEVAQAALIALGDNDAPTDLALKLDLQVRHILVDEFQDTSQLQLQLLEKLTAGWQPDDGRTLFIVGDGMQSCYGFRNANVGIFLDARARGIGEVPLNPLDLQVNFRSDRAVVDWVNEIFRQAFPAQDNIGRGAVRYLDSVAFREGKPETHPAVQFYGCIDDPERLHEAEQVTTLVGDLRASDPEGRIAILVRKKRHLAQILPALDAAGIRYQAPELAPLASKMAIIDLLSLTRALLDPSDRLSWLAVLRAPWCGLSWSDLHCLANWNNGALHATDAAVRPLLQALDSLDEVTGLSEEGRVRLLRTTPLLSRAWQERGRKPLRSLIEGLWLSLGGPACTAPEEVANVADYFRLLERYDRGGYIPDWQEFQLGLEKLFARPGEDARVQVMTIHKSKGLEFEHVLIPGLDQGGKPGGDQLLRWAEWLNNRGESRFLLAPKSARGDRDPLFDFLKFDNNERERLEGTRLLYVGCTRAIHSLHLLGCVEQEEKKPSFKAPGAASLLAGIWESISEQCEWCHWLAPDDSASAGATTAGAEHDRDYFLHLPDSWETPRFPALEWMAPYRMPDYQPTPSDEPNLPELGKVGQRWLRHAGTIAHETLATIAETGIEGWDEQRVSDQRPLWQARLRQLGLSGTSLEFAAEKVQQAVLRALNCQHGRWLLDNKHKDSACELTVHTGGRQLRTYIIDRTFVDDQGVRWIVDYKTAEPVEGQDREVFIGEQLESYRDQLEIYSRLFIDRGERKIRRALYFPLLQELAEL
ncbi:ATP-dependent helicase/nuclease subunit A [Microbulbifer aggregans]|uniref:DNA 3'-5' helicase n=1 Tax=Microbulbifer aggregans TaxID=1769779 RepID=A0A1C9WA73_9GAMM|nr:UvrD-helicase domain-containing protein [Microbulbifer aggregans]AOS98059.1 ATP-dependent helicase/nuclease subunit A [Microbulbifer aggregans]